MDEPLTCGICSMHFDDKQSIPLILPCTAKHTICAICLKNILAKNQSQYNCPWDREVLQKQNIEDFVTNSELLACIRFATSTPIGSLCKLHEKELEFVCLECGVKICYLCEYEEVHSNHQTKLLSDHQEKVKSLIESFNLLMEKANKIETEKKALKDQNKENMKKIIDDSYDKLIEFLIEDKARIKTELNAKIENETVITSDHDKKLIKLIDEIKDALKKINPKAEIIEIQKDPEGMGLEEIFNEENIQEKDEDAILKSTVFIEREASKITEIEKVVNNLLEENKNIESRLKKLSIYANEEIYQILKAFPLVEIIGFGKVTAQDSHHLQTSTRTEYWETTLQDEEEDVLAKLNKLSKLDSHKRAQEFSDLFNQKLGKQYEIKIGVSDDFENKLQLLFDDLDDKTAHDEMRRFLDDIAAENPLLITELIAQAKFNCENLTSKGLEYLNNFLCNFTSLKSLELNFHEYKRIYQKVSDQGVLRFHKSFSILSNLHKLSITFYRWSDSSIESLCVLADMIEVPKVLKSLSVEFYKCHVLEEKDVNDFLKLIEDQNKLLILKLKILQCKKIKSKHAKNLRSLLPKLKIATSNLEYEEVI